MPSLESHEPRSGFQPLAVIGMAARFPGEATDIEKLWQLIVAGKRAAQSSKSSHGYNSESFHHPDLDHAGSVVAPAMYTLSESADGFDAPFFSMRIEEVLSVDPQQKLVLENVFHALENGKREE